MKILLAVIIPAIAMFISCSKSAQTDEHLKKAHSFYLNGDFAKAEMEAQESLKSNPDLKEANILLSRLYFKDGRDKEFEKIIKGMIKKNSYDVDALRMNSLYLIKKKNYKEARENLNKILSISEDDLSSLYLLGSLNQIEGNMNEALKNYTTAMRSYVHLKKIHESLGEIYKKLEMKDRESENNKILKAIIKYEESLE